MRSSAPPLDRGEVRKTSDPQPGHWLIRLTAGGPRVPAAVMWVETTTEPGEPENDMRGTRSRFLAAFIAGEACAIEDVWHRRGEAIDEADYLFRTAEAAWCAKYAPDEPIANPRKRVVLSQLRIPF